MSDSLHDDHDEIAGKSWDGQLMRRFVAYLRPYRWRVVASVLLILATTATELALPFLSKIAIDNYIRVNDGDGLIVILGVMVGILAVDFVLRYLRSYLMVGVGQGVMYDLRVQLFAHIEKLSLSFFDRTPVGRIMARLTGDVDALNEFLTQGVVELLSSAVMLFGVTAVILLLDWRLALVMFAILPLMGVVGYVFQRWSRITFRQIRARNAAISGFLQENIGGAQVVQLFNREKRAAAQFDGLNVSYRRAAINNGLAFGFFFPMMELLIAIATASLLWVGGKSVLEGAITFGTLVAFIQYLDRTYAPIENLAEKYSLLQGAVVACERIFTILDEKPEIADPTNPVPLPGIAGRIEFQDVHFSYEPDEPVLRSVSFTIEAGQSVAIVGATGAGKTSIISLLARFYDVQKGRILIDGHDVRDVRQADLRKHIGTVLQDPVLFSGTIARNIRLLDDSISDERVREAAGFVNASPFIERLEGGYDYVVKERGSNLSTGQRQLLAFARAIAFNPEVLLVLDEATSSVDTENEALIQDALEKLMRGRTSIIIAHRLSTIRHVDKVIVLHRGQVVEMGTHDELLARRGFYYRLYSLQYATQEVA